MLESQGYIPIPDPTELTTEAVDKLRDEVNNLMRIKLNALRELFEEKFKGVSTEFHMRDIALAAAFKAAEAAVQQQNASNTLAIDKSATSFTKQIDGLDEKINDLKERFSELHSRNWVAVGGYLVGVIGVIGVIIGIIFSVMRFHGT